MCEWSLSAAVYSAYNVKGSGANSRAKEGGREGGSEAGTLDVCVANTALSLHDSRLARCHTAGSRSLARAAVAVEEGAAYTFEPSLDYGLAGSKETKYEAVLYGPCGVCKYDFYLILM